MNKKRNDLRGDGLPLTSNPFAGLAKNAENPGNQTKNSDPTVPLAPTQNVPRALPMARVARTRKGGIPVSVEKRSGGKVVTILANVTGDANALLSYLRKKCGAGGVVREGAIELQGDHVAKLETLVRDFLV